MILNVFWNWPENKEGWRSYSLIPSKGLQNLAIRYFIWLYQRAKCHPNNVEMTFFFSLKNRSIEMHTVVSWDTDKFD